MSTIGKQYHEAHNSFSQKLLDEIIKTRDELLNSIKDANQAYWDKVIPCALNHLIFDLHTAIHNFQQIEIKTNAAKFAKAGLQNVINIYNKIAYELQTELGKDLDIPKSLFKTYIPQIIDVAQTLLGIIKDDKLYEYEEEEIEILNGILVSLAKVSVILQMENPELIINIVKKKLDQFNRVFDDIDFNNPNVLENLKKHVDRANVQTPGMVHHILKQSHNYEGKLKSEMVKTADFIQIIVAQLVTGIQEAKNANEAVAKIKYTYNIGFGRIKEFVEYLISESKTVSVPDNILTLARFFGHECYGLLTRDIQYYLSDSVVAAQN